MIKIEECPQIIDLLFSVAFLSNDKIFQVTINNQMYSIQVHKGRGLLMYIRSLIMSLIAMHIDDINK